MHNWVRANLTLFFYSLFYFNTNTQLWMQLEYLDQSIVTPMSIFHWWNHLRWYKKNIFNLMSLLTNKCIFYKSRENMGIFISELKKSISLFNLMEKKAYDTIMMLDKFTIRWSMLHNFITSPEVSIRLYFIFFKFFFLISHSNTTNTYV